MRDGPAEASNILQKGEQEEYFVCLIAKIDRQWQVGTQEADEGKFGWGCVCGSVCRRGKRGRGGSYCCVDVSSPNNQILVGASIGGGSRCVTQKSRLSSATI